MPINLLQQKDHSQLAASPVSVEATARNPLRVQQAIKMSNRFDLAFAIVSTAGAWGVRILGFYPVQSGRKHCRTS